MKHHFKVLVTLISFLCAASLLHAQHSDMKLQQKVQKLVEQGTQLLDAGNHIEAIKKLQEAVELDASSPAANYELGYVWYLEQDWNKAIKYSRRVVTLGRDYQPEAYIVYGSALDQRGNTVGAAEIFKEAIQKFPKNYLLYYNYAYTSFNAGNTSLAADALYKALEINPMHGSSHLLLGYVMNSRKENLKTLLPLCFFLMENPSTSDSKNAVNLLEKVRNRIINKQAGNSNDSLYLQLVHSVVTGEEEAPDLCALLNILFLHLHDFNLPAISVYNNEYIPFFYALAQAEHTEAFCYYIMQSSGRQKVDNWLKTHPDQLEQFADWLDKYNLP